MKPFLKLARLAGIDIYLHASFALLVIWITVTQYNVGEHWSDVAGGLLFTTLIFFAVVVHELGHALVARRFGIRTHDITLFPIGGVARMDRLPTWPREELLVALAGPALNVTLALILFSLQGGHRNLSAFDLPWADSGHLLERFAWINLGLAGFNLLPTFPLDGGRVLRALLCWRGESSRATRTAATVGWALAVVIGLASLAFNPFLALIAVFIWIGATDDVADTELHAAITGLHVGEVMLRDCRTFQSDESLSAAAIHLLAITQENYPVVERDGGFVGLLSRTDLVAGLAALGPDDLVGKVVHRQIITVHPEETVRHLLQRWPSGVSAVAVVSEHKFLGLFTTENLSEFLMVHSALGQHAHVPAAG